MEMFVTGFALSLSACLDLGIVNVATVKRGLDAGVRAAFALSLGSCIGDQVYAALSLFGLGLVLAEPHVRVVFWLGGTVVLLYLGVSMTREAWRGRPLSTGGGPAQPIPLWRDFGRGIALALSSPSLIVWFASAGGAVIAGIYRRTQSPPLFFLAGFLCAGVVWALGISLVSGKGRHMLGAGAIRVCSGASAAIFLGLAVKVFLDGLAAAG
jgi:L-lysine exporter family protein LysE/ArgO